MPKPNPTSSLSRRTVIAGAAAVGIGVTLRTAPDASASLARGVTFPEGVMAGVPHTAGATLWTRTPIGLLEPDRKLALVVSRNEDLSAPEIVTEVTAQKQWDGTVHKTVQGLAAGEQYYYQFRGGDTESPAGRFRTLRPADSNEPVKIGFFTCQSYTDGYYAAHRHLAAEDLDLVVCLGDYVYEASLPGVRQDLNIYPQILPAMRAKYTHYRQDAGLRAMHAKHAFVPLWDDHEFRNNYTKNKWTVPFEPLFQEKKSAAWHAWFERMPVPRFYPDDMTRIYRSLRLGRTVELFQIDTRQYRDDQPCDDGSGVACDTTEDPQRTMLGAAQRRWLTDGLQDSSARWQLLANPNMLMGMASGANGERAWLDTWDGYGAERTDVLSAAAAAESNLLVVTGDDHDTYVGELWDTGFAPTTPDGVNPKGSTRAGVEFVVPSVTSGNTGDSAGADGAKAEEQSRLAKNPHLKGIDMIQHGYGVLRVDQQEARLSFRAVDKLDPDAAVGTSTSFTVQHGEHTVQPA